MFLGSDHSLISHEHHTRRILTELESGRGLSQRSLANQLGIALGLTNLLVRRMVKKGWVRVVRIRPNRMQYLLTPTGLAEKVRMTQAYLRTSVRFYARARNRIRERFELLSHTWPADSNGNDGNETGHGEKRLVFYGAGEVAEIGYICLQGTDLGLVGVVDDKAKNFFDVPVCSRADLRRDSVAGRPYDRLVVMSFADTERLRAKMADLDIDPARVFWL